MDLPQHDIDVVLPSGAKALCRMTARVDLSEQTGLLKAAIFHDSGTGQDIVAAKRLGQWGVLETVEGRPAIEVAREVLESSSLPAMGL